MHFPSFTLSLPILSSLQLTGIWPDSHKWHPPSATDLRGPCPGLNTLANHGYIPRNGQNITIPVVKEGMHSAYHLTTDTMVLGVHLALVASPHLDQFSLADIRLHNVIESDASLSRSDFALGDNYNFNETIFQTLANSNPGVDYYNATSAGQVQKQRLADDQKANPNITNTVKELGVRTLASSLYLATMGDPVTGAAPKKYVQAFFRDERLPIEEGWRRSPVPITLDHLRALQAVIIKNSDWAPGPGTTIPTLAVVSLPNDIFKW